MLESAERLAAAAENLAAVEDRLAATLAAHDRRARFNVVERVGIAVLLAIMAAALVVLFVIAVGNKHNGELIRDCTIPNGDCYRQQQQRTGDVVGELQRLAVSAAQCADAGTDPQIQACIEAKLRAGR